MTEKAAFRYWDAAFSFSATLTRLAMMHDIQIPSSRIVFAADGSATFAPDGPLDIEVLSALLIRVITRAAQGLAGGDTVTPVSITIDVIGAQPQRGELHFSPSLDRKTRTIIFSGGEATCGGQRVLSATCVYRIGGNI